VGFEKVCRDWSQEDDFDWINLCDKLRDKWFYLPINVGWDGISNWGAGHGANRSLDDLLLVFKHNRQASSLTKARRWLVAQLGEWPYAVKALEFFDEALERGVYPKSIVLEEMCDPEYVRKVKHKVVHWVVDRVLEAARKFPEAEVEALVLGVCAAPGPVVEQMEVSMWECCEYIRRLGERD
jgi:hypothetical protein